MIDLHSHTTASDGQHTALELFTLAKARGVTHLAVTDHDTVAGLDAAEKAAQATGLSLVPGIELSAFLDRREVHILGHFVRAETPELIAFGTKLHGERDDRMVGMIAKLGELGVKVTIDEVRALAGDAQLGRPHLARVLVERRFVTSTKEAFDRFLGDGRPACVERFKLTAKEAIAMIHRAGGAATLAHPAVSKMDRYEIRLLAEVGLDGLEAFHSDHVPSQREKYLAIARENGLVPTGGSDFHGEKVAPGRQLGDAFTPPEHFAALESRAQAARA